MLWRKGITSLRAAYHRRCYPVYGTIASSYPDAIAPHCIMRATAEGFVSSPVMNSTPFPNENIWTMMSRWRSQITPHSHLSRCHHQNFLHTLCVAREAIVFAREAGEIRRVLSVLTRCPGSFNFVYCQPVAKRHKKGLIVNGALARMKSSTT